MVMSTTKPMNKSREADVGKSQPPIEFDGEVI
jgi:hypothetical protein